MQVRHFPLGFGTSTGLTTQIGYFASQINSHFSNRVTSSSRASTRTVPKRLCFWDFAGTFLSKFKVCTITFRLSPTISSCDQAKTSMLFLKNSTNSFFLSVPRIFPTFTTLEGTSRSMFISSSSSIALSSYLSLPTHGSMLSRWATSSSSSRSSSVPRVTSITRDSSPP